MGCLVCAQDLVAAGPQLEAQAFKGLALFMPQTYTHTPVDESRPAFKSWFTGCGMCESCPCTVHWFMQLPFLVPRNEEAKVHVSLSVGQHKCV